MFYYQGQVVRTRLISKFPKDVLNKIAPGAEWAAQLLIVSRWFTEADCHNLIEDDGWMSCCDLDSDRDDPNIYLEVVVGGIGPVTLKSPNSKDIVAGRLMLDQDTVMFYDVEQEAPTLLYECEDIFTKQVKNRPYLRRHKHIEKGGRLLWNLQKGRFVAILSNNEENNCKISEVNVPTVELTKDEQFVAAL
jgi:hypothetical protein